MKTNSTLKCILFTLITIFSLSFTAVNAQCVAPAMVWKNAVLTSGTAGQPGAAYKFPSVTPGVDAMVYLQSLVGGATLTSIDDNTYGYSAAWQPVVKTPAVIGISTSYASFRIEFKDSATGANHTFPCFQLSFIDVDGDNVGVQEFVAAKNADSVTVSNTTLLGLTWLSGNLVQATGPILNFTGIDTSAWNTNINYRYSNTDKVLEVRIGSITALAFTPQDRFTSAFFQQITMGSSSLLPVKYASFDAVANDNKVTLKWITEDEVNNDHFEVERSFDGVNFTTIGLVLDGFANGNRKTYMFKDNAAELQTKTVVYYRLKQIDNNGKAVYTNKLVVRLQAKAGVTMQVSPNPFVQDLNMQFTATANGTAHINIISITGQKMVTKQASVSKGLNTLQVNGLTNLAPGMYTVQLIIDGVIISNQKIIKN
ncbi:T9SS type A sorting domain-containing protein [Ferruginibacter sp.]